MIYLPLSIRSFKAEGGTKETEMLYQINDGTVSLGGHPILSHIHFEIKGKEKIAVVGRNGAGKTTLLRLIAGVYRADAGEIRIDGRRASCVAAKQEVFYMPDRQYYDRNATPLTVGHFCGNF